MLFQWIKERCIIHSLVVQAVVLQFILNTGFLGHLISVFMSDTPLTSWWMLLLWGPNPSKWEHGWNHIHPFVPPTHCPSRLSHFPVFSSVITDFSFAHPLHSSQISSCYGHEWMWELDHKEGWAPKNWCFQIVMLEKTLESPLYCKVIKPVNPKGNQPSLEGLMLTLKLQYLGHLMQRVNSLEKTLMLGKIDGRMRRGWQRMR